MKALIHNKIMQKPLAIFASITITVLAFADVAGAMQGVEQVVGELQQIVDDNPGTPLADKAEDALAKAQNALDELAKTPPDYQAAVGNIEGAVGDLQAAVEDELLDAEQGTELMNLLTCAVCQLGAGAVYQAIDCEADADKIAEAEQALSEGLGLWIAGAYKDAVNKYKDALATAEGVISEPFDPLAALVAQDSYRLLGWYVGRHGDMWTLWRNWTGRSSLWVYVPPEDWPAFSVPYLGGPGYPTPNPDCDKDEYGQCIDPPERYPTGSPIADDNIW